MRYPCHRAPFSAGRRRRPPHFIVPHFIVRLVHAPARPRPWRRLGSRPWLPLFSPHLLLSRCRCTCPLAGQTLCGWWGGAASPVVLLSGGSGWPLLPHLPPPRTCAQGSRVLGGAMTCELRSLSTPFLCGHHDDSLLYFFPSPPAGRASLAPPFLNRKPMPVTLQTCSESRKKGLVLTAFQGGSAVTPGRTTT